MWYDVDEGAREAGFESEEWDNVEGVVEADVEEPELVRSPIRPGFDGAVCTADEVEGVGSVLEEADFAVDETTVCGCGGGTGATTRANDRTGFF